MYAIFQIEINYRKPGKAGVVKRQLRSEVNGKRKTLLPSGPSSSVGKSV